MILVTLAIINLLIALICFWIGLLKYENRYLNLAIVFFVIGMLLTAFAIGKSVTNVSEVKCDTIQVNNMSPYIELNGNYISTDELRGIVRKSKTRKTSVSLEFYYDSCTLTIPFSSEEEQEIAIKQLKEQLIEKTNNIGFKNGK